MVDGRHLENQKTAIFPQRFDRSAQFGTIKHFDPRIINCHWSVYDLLVIALTRGIRMFNRGGSSQRPRKFWVGQQEWCTWGSWG